jgi:peptidoglycan hydrolase-like amidase
MEMAIQGYSWSEILLYYYSDVKLQHLSQLKRL